MKAKRPAADAAEGRPRSMIVAGVMSGTSADGVDVALCRIKLQRSTRRMAEPGQAERPETTRARQSRSTQARWEHGLPRVQVLGHRNFAYDRQLRSAVLAAAGGEALSAAMLARLSWRLGEVYAECVATTARECKLQPQLIACHGQTILHQASPARFLGAPLRCTLQIGATAPITERLRVPVVSDFRPADLAAGGQGAPLIPMLDFCLFQHPTRNRVLLNLGGIANLTALPAGASGGNVLAFDTGPANMVLDACMQALYKRAFDKDGAVAARGRVLTGVVQQLMQAPYFSAPPPKSCGREQFGAEFVAQLLKLCARDGAGKRDIVATAAALTAQTVLDAYTRFCWPYLGQRAPLARATDLLVAGGGARNLTLMRMLRETLEPLGVKLAALDSLGIAAEAKEAAAFALLGWLTWHGLPGNVPSATGASRPVVLGAVSLA